MMPRVTHNMMSDKFLTNLSSVFGRLQKVHDQLTSGRRIQRPSDDPPGATKALSLRSALQLNEQYLRTIDLSKSWLDTSEAALSTLTDVVQRSRELAIQGANDTLTAVDRAASAKELDQLVGSALAAANTQQLGSYLFSGTKITTSPFSLAGSTVTYNGNTGLMQREIGPGLTVPVNVTGDQLTSSLQTLVDLRDAFNTGTSAAVSAQLDPLDAALNQILKLRADVGARINRFDFTDQRLQDIQLSLTALLSGVQDVDTAETASKFAQEQTAYQAALAAGGKAIQPSLMDFLR